MDFTEKTLKEKEIYKGKIITVNVDEIELPNGKKAIREVVKHSGGVCVGALTKDKELYFVRQYRYPYKKVLSELPAGKLEKGEDPLEAGLRELKEECGVVAKHVMSMGTVYPTVAYCDEIIHLFVAWGLEKTSQSLDEDEFLSFEKIPVEKAVELVMNGEISDSKTVALVLKIDRLIKEGKIG
ncbi:MAG: NUDIX domain-containing protein [Acutalibacteraceae bacterium]